MRDAVKKSEEEDRFSDLRDPEKKYSGGVLDRAAERILEAAKEKCGKNDDRTAAVLRIRRLPDSAT